MDSCLYTVRKVSKEDRIYGPSHGTEDCDKTLCGIQINETWYLTDHSYNGTITCADCLEAIEK